MKLINEWKRLWFLIQDKNHKIFLQTISYKLLNKQSDQFICALETVILDNMFEVQVFK